MKKPNKKIGVLILIKRKLKALAILDSMISLVILVMVTAMFSSAYINITRTTTSNNNSIQANLIMAETVEALRSIRDQNYMFLTNGQHGLSRLNDVWAFEGSGDLVDGVFQREVTISDAYRNSLGDLAVDATNLDSRSKKVYIAISWSTDVEGDRILDSEYTISDSFAFDAVNTTSAEWTLGTHDLTDMSQAGNGALVLARPYDTIPWNQHHTYDVSGSPGAVTAYETTVYTAEDELIVWDVADPANATVLSNTALDSKAVEMILRYPYLYILEENDDAELVVMNVSDSNSPQQVASFDLPGDKKATSLDIGNNGHILYVGMKANSESEVYLLDIFSLDAISVLRAVEIGNDVKDIVLDNHDLYLAVDDYYAFWSLDVLDIDHIVGLKMYINGHGARAIARKGNLIAIGTEEKEFGEELVFVDIQNPDDPFVSYRYEIGKKVNALHVFNNFLYITHNAIESEKMVVLKLKNNFDPVRVIGTDLDGNGNDIFVNANAVYVVSHDFNVFSYALSTTEYYLQGNYVSEPIDSGSDSAIWKGFYWDGVIPSQSQVSFQLRTSATEGGLPNAPWLAADGTVDASFSDTEEIIVQDTNGAGARWAQYKVNLTDSGIYTPEIYSVRLQFSP